MKESGFQAKLIREIKLKYPDCLILKNDANYKQGIPDLLILSGSRWAFLEVKRSKDARHQPNQDWYVEMLNRMGFARFVYPENEKTVMEEMKEWFSQDSTIMTRTEGSTPSSRRRNTTGQTIQTKRSIR